MLIGLAVLTAATMTVGQFGEAPLGQQGVAVALIGLFVSACGATLWFLSDQPYPSLGWIGIVPAAWVVGIGVFMLAFNRPKSIEWFIGGDNVRHVTFVAELIDTGSLDYSQNPYPRGWHNLLALIWLSTGHELGSSSISSFILLNAIATWLLFALLVLASSNLAVSLTRIMNLGTGQSAPWSSLLAGCWLLTPRFMADTLALGFQTTVLAAIVLAVAVRECLVDRARQKVALVIFVSMFVLMAHTWQLLLPAVALPLVVVGWRSRRLDVPSRFVTAALIVVGIAAAAPPLVAAFMGPGLGAASSPGVGSVPEVPVIIACLLAAGYFVFRIPARYGLLVGFVVFAPALGSAFIAAFLGISMTSYYPGKMLWHSVVLGLSFLAVLSLAAVDRLLAFASPGRLAGLLLAPCIAALAAWGLFTPIGSQLGYWSTVDARRVMTAINLPGVSMAQAVWMDTATESAVTRTLVSSLGGRPLADDRWTVAQECAALRSAATPTVVTSRPEAEARRRYACVRRVVILDAQRSTPGTHG